jgi:biopolymer transport protein TolR
MGMTAGGRARTGGRRRRGVPRYAAMADINMTPFIDVMLVLLIIFMVAAPLLATGVPIDLPKTKASALNIDQKPISVAIDDKGEVFLMDQPVPIEQLAEKLQAAAKDGFDERIYVRDAAQVNYEHIAKVMSIIISSGYKRVALVTEPTKN